MVPVATAVQVEAFALLAAGGSDAIDRRELLSALARLQARWVNQLGGRGTRTVQLTPAQEEAYLAQVRQLFDRLRQDRPSLATVTAEQIETFAHSGLLAFNPHQRRAPDGRWTDGGWGGLSHANVDFTPEERQFLSDYVEDGRTYREVNDALRGNREMTPEMADKVRRLDSIVARAELPEDATLYRAVSVKQSDPLLSQVIRKQQIVDPGFGSVSGDQDAVEDFQGVGSNAIIFEIKARKGQPVLVLGDDLAENAMMQTAQEALLPRGYRLNVDKTNSRRVGDTTVWTVQATYDGAPDPEALTAAFNPHQRRGPNGRWIKGGAPGHVDLPGVPKTAAQAVDDWADQMRAAHPDLKLDIAQTRSGHVVLSRIELPKSARGKGTGSEVMRSLVDLADEHGLTLALTPSGDFGGSVARLRRFYESFGFVRNKGKNRDYGTTEDYVRPPRGGLAASQGRPVATDAQRELFEALFGFNPHQRRGPDGRWIRMPTSELKGPRRGKGRARVRHVEIEHRDGRPVYKIGGRERHWTPAEARAVADALDATAAGQSVPAPVPGRVVSDGVQRRTVEQVQPFRGANGKVVLDVGRDRGRDGSGEVELTDKEAKALARDLRAAAAQHENPAPIAAPEPTTELPPVKLKDPQTAYREVRDEYNGAVYSVAWNHRQKNGDRRRPDEYLNQLMDEYDAAQPWHRDKAADNLRIHLDSYYDGKDILDPRPDEENYAALPTLPPGYRTPGGPRPATTAPYGQRREALDRSIRSGLDAQDVISQGAMGDTRRIQLADGTDTIYKRAKADWYNGWTKEDQTDAEELASLVADAVGVRAPAIQRASPTELYMEVMPGKTADARGWRSPPDAIWGSDQGLKMGLLDVLLNNSDRHGGNWMVDDADNIAAIDHGLAFKSSMSGNASPFAARLLDYNNNAVDNPFTAGDIRRVRERLEALKPRFEALGRDQWYTDTLRRLNKIDAGAVGRTDIYPPDQAVTAAQRDMFARVSLLNYDPREEAR